MVKVSISNISALNIVTIGFPITGLKATRLVSPARAIRQLSPSPLAARACQLLVKPEVVDGQRETVRLPSVKS
jgi:hypothetical protein